MPTWILLTGWRLQQGPVETITMTGYQTNGWPYQ